MPPKKYPATPATDKRWTRGDTARAKQVAEAPPTAPPPPPTTINPPNFNPAPPRDPTPESAATSQAGQTVQLSQNPTPSQSQQTGQAATVSNIHAHLPGVAIALNTVYGVPAHTVAQTQSTGQATHTIDTVTATTTADIPIPSVEATEPNPVPGDGESHAGAAEEDSGDNERNTSQHPVRTTSNPGPRVLVSTYSFGPDHIDQTPPGDLGENPDRPDAPPLRPGCTSSPPSSHHSDDSQDGTRSGTEPPIVLPPRRPGSGSSGTSSSHSSRGSGGESKGRRRWFTPAPGGSPGPDPGAEVAGPVQRQPPRSFWEILWEQIYAGLMHLVSPQAQFSSVAGFTLLIFQLCSAGRLCYKGDGQCIWDHLWAVTPFIGKHFISWFCLLGANTLAILGICDMAIGDFGQLEPFLMLVATFGLKKLPMFSHFGDVSVPIRFIWISGGIHLVKWFLQAIEMYWGKVRQDSSQLRRPYVLSLLCVLVVLTLWLNRDVMYEDRQVAKGWSNHDGSERGFLNRNRNQAIEGVNMIKVTHRVVTEWVDPTNIAYGPM